MIVHERSKMESRRKGDDGRAERFVTCPHGEEGQEVVKGLVDFKRSEKLQSLGVAELEYTQRASGGNSEESS